MKRTCRHCGGPVPYDAPSLTCGHCACLTNGIWVASPEGPGEIVQICHSGGFIVLFKDGRTRRFPGSALTIQEDKDSGEWRVASGEQDKSNSLTTSHSPLASGASAATTVVDPEPAIVADHTTDCPPLPSDPLASIRRTLLSRPFPAWATTPQPR